MIDVKCDVPLYEIDGDAEGASNARPLVVQSHWNDDDWVVLELGQERVTVNGRALKAAIDNATNSARH